MVAVCGSVSLVESKTRLELIVKLPQGPDRHVVAYPLRNATQYNLVLINATGTGPSLEKTSGADNYNRAVPADSVRQLYADFEPRVRAVLALTDDFKAWQLNPGAGKLESWYRDSVVLAGDAAHAMLPYMAQGAAQAVEDAAVLALCVSHGIRQLGDPAAYLQLYQDLRQPRVHRVMEESAANGDRWHLPDGQEQQLRDSNLKNMGGRRPPSAGGLPAIPDLIDPKIPFTDPRFHMWLFGLDVEARVMANDT